MIPLWANLLDHDRITAVDFDPNQPRRYVRYEILPPIATLFEANGQATMHNLASLQRELNLVSDPAEGGLIQRAIALLQKGDSMQDDNPTPFPILSEDDITGAIIHQPSSGSSDSDAEPVIQINPNLPHLDQHGWPTQDTLEEWHRNHGQ